MNKDLNSKNKLRSNKKKPIIINIITIILGLGLIGGIYWLYKGNEFYISDSGELSILKILFTFIFAIIIFYFLYGLWVQKNWARTSISILLILFLTYEIVTTLFDVSSEVFAGDEVMPIIEILKIFLSGLLEFLKFGALPIFSLYIFSKTDAYYVETPQQREFINKSIKYVLLFTALSAIFIVFLIILFTFMESFDAIQKIGLDNMLLGTIWRPGHIIGEENKGQFGLIPMIVGTILSTIGAAIIGVPLSIFSAILLAEVAPHHFREIVRPAIELLAGIPSVIYGLFGMVVLAKWIRIIDIPHNTGFGLLNASIILAIMIIPTITTVAEDAICAVPKIYKEGSLALGATRWETISRVMLPASRSGIIAATILGVGRALGETMAMIMVIGNSIALPKPITNNPLSIIFSSARTLTGNIAVEINYAAGEHRSALFFTGIILFLMIYLVNTLARFLMRERNAK